MTGNGGMQQAFLMQERGELSYEEISALIDLVVAFETGRAMAKYGCSGGCGEPKTMSEAHACEKNCGREVYPPMFR